MERVISFVVAIIFMEQPSLFLTSPMEDQKWIHTRVGVS